MSTSLNLSDFCDMDEFEQILSDWSLTSHMSAIVRDVNHRYITHMHGFTRYCRHMLSSEKGNIACKNCDDNSCLFCCHAGLCDFSLPIALPDGKVIAYAFCGQVRLPDNERPDFNKLAETYHLDVGTLYTEYDEIQIKSKTEIEAAKALLSSAVNTFVAKNYEIWLSKHEDQADKTLSQITQILYAYNITLNLSTGKYTLITGTGMDRLVSIYQMNTDYETAQKEAGQFVHPGYSDKLSMLLNIENLKNAAGNDGHIDTEEYPVLYPDAESYEWHEVNVFASHDSQGQPVINILGRDVTEAHNLQEKNNREIRAAAARNQILSDLTKMLYSYNLTLNLNSGKYTLIEGTGMTKFMEIFKSTDDYPTAYSQKTQYILPDSLEQFAAIASIEALRGHRNSHGFIGNLEYGALTDHGEEWHEINVFISTDEQGNPLANILGRDITEIHKRQEQREIAQRAAAARDQLLSGVTKMLYSFNVTVNLKTWKYSLITGTGCEPWVKILQDSDDYVLSQNKIRHIVEDESKEVLDSLTGISALTNAYNRSGYVGTATTSSRTDGKRSWQEINLFMGTNEYGEPTANILGRDITEQHQRQEEKEKELRASAAKDQILSEITKTLYSYNISVNLETGKYSLITGTGMEHYVSFLTSTDDFGQAHDFAVKYIDPDYLETYNELVSLDSLRKKASLNGHIGTLEYPTHTGFGLEWHEVNVFISSSMSGEAIANILGRDITEAHDRADTKAQLEIAEASSKSKTQFLFNMSHDIRTPMNAIIGFTDLLRKHLDNRELAENYISKIKSSNEFLLSLINNILEMARIESGKETLDETLCDVCEFGESIEAVFDSQMKEKGLSFSRSILVQHPSVFCDETKLREIMLNLLSNAYKYTPAGGSVSMNVTELPSEISGFVIYKTVISDTGIGMSKDFLPHLFDEFSRERNSTESKIIGTGLGMPIVKNLVNLMQGTIEVESELGKGTTFTVTLPLRISAQEAKQEDNGQESETEELNFDGKHILLAEDNDLNAEIAMTILEEVGFQIDRAEDGVVCVSMLEKAVAGTYDVILMDIQMPNLNGYDATKRIRAFMDPAKANIPILAMTANAFEEDKRNAFRAGMNGHIAKPIDIAELMGELSRVLV